MKKNLFFRAAAVAVIGAMAITSVSAAGIEEIPFLNAAKSLKATIVNMATEKGQIKTASSYTELIEAKIISQETADKMNSYMESHSQKMIEEFAEVEAAEQETSSEGAEKGIHIAISATNIFDEMVADGIITQDEADAINAYTEEQLKKAQTDQINADMDRYVEEKILDEETADAAADYLITNFDEIQKDVKGKNMTATGYGVDSMSQVVIGKSTNAISTDGTIGDSSKTPNIHFSVLSATDDAVTNDDIEVSENLATDSRQKVKMISFSIIDKDCLVEAGIITEAQLNKMNESDEANMEKFMDAEFSSDVELDDAKNILN